MMNIILNLSVPHSRSLILLRTRKQIIERIIFIRKDWHKTCLYLFQVEPKDSQFTLQEGGQPVRLVFRATVPILCKHGYPNNCKIRVHIGAGEDITALGPDMCDLVFDTGAANQVKTIELVAKTDFRIDGDQTVILKSQILINFEQNDWFKHHDLPHKQVRANSLLREIIK